MPKQLYVINDFSGGINNKKDPRDIQDNELSHIQNMSIDALGKIRTIGGFFAHIKDQDGSTSLSSPNYISSVTSNNAGGGGYGLFYFESDHSNASDETITLVEDGGSALAIGTGNGNINFGEVNTYTDSGRDDPEVSLGP